ncbi:MAG: response regulator [Deltaproteobacteria bacterium]|nr:response regulator [Kofleriaceae bacterium]
MARVLIVDDDFDMRDTLRDILEDEGLGVGVAADGLEALAWLQSNPPPALILLDWMMPRCDGAEFRARQRASPQLANIPVVLLTADLRIRDQVDALGAVDFLAKPVRLARLLEVVRRYCDPAAST